MVRLYMDDNVRGAITRGLRRRGVDVVTAQEDGRDATPDPDVLDRASELGRVLFSQDDDLLIEASARQESGVPFAGVIFAHQSTAIGTCVEDLEVLALLSESEEFASRVRYLPMR